MNEITDKFRSHFRVTLQAHGPTSEGLDWGSDQAKVDLRYSKMLALLQPSQASVPSLLDVGCGYGGLLGYARDIGLQIDYTGINVVEEMIQCASKNNSTGSYILGDVLETPKSTKFDYVVCSGILTGRLEVSVMAMDQYAQAIIRRMYDLCTVGVAFNVMSTKVNFYSNKLYYRNRRQNSWRGA